MRGRLTSLLCVLWAVQGCSSAGGPSPAASPGPSRAIDVTELTVEQIQAAYADGEYNAVQLTQAFLDRIDLHEDHYNALISMNPDALAVAAARDEEYRSGRSRGPLHGVPVVIKDNLDYAGLVTTAGYSGFSAAAGGVDMIPGDDAAAVERLRDAGAIVLGKTNLPDFAGDGTRPRSSVAGVTLNAYDVTRAPGGSSGGTATAVNASFAVLGLGTETGGSIQNPAGAQGLVGVKPTYGLVPLEGVVPISATYLDVVGPLAKTVYDAAVTLDVLAGPSPEDLATYASVGHMPEGGYAAQLSTSALEGKRFGLVGLGWREQWLPLAPETEVLYEEAITVLRAQGAQAVMDPFMNSSFVELYGERPRAPSVGSHDMLVYLQGLGDDAAFHSVEEWEALTGDDFRGRGRQNRRPPARPSATEEGDAYQGLAQGHPRALPGGHGDLRSRRTVLPTGRSAHSRPRRRSRASGLQPQQPSGACKQHHQRLGLPVVTVPFAYYADGTPFVLALIGDMWTEADLLAYAYDFEQATHGRVAPTLLQRAAGR